jgi:DNA-binding HxlR family transcriptional regulator
MNPNPGRSGVRASPARAAEDSAGAGTRPVGCCPFYHEAVELIGRRWTGAIVAVLLQQAPLRFSEIAQAVPQLSDRLLSERMKELEARGVVRRTVDPGPPVKVTYDLTEMGRSLQPAIAALEDWARYWLRRSGRPPAAARDAPGARPHAS